MAFTIKFDYRFDTTGFFDDPDRRVTLEAAAAEWEMIIRDDFDEMPAGSTFDIRDPSNPTITHEITLTEPIGDILIFVGARSFPGSSAAVAGPSGYDIEGDQYRARISNDFRSNRAITDFEPWTGTISFNTDTNWHYNMDEPPNNKLDLFTVAVHEIAHVLGIGTSGAFDALVIAGEPPAFHGVNATALNGGIPVPLDHHEGHVAEGFADDVVVLDPTMSSGVRMRLSEFDKAMLADIGYDIAGFVKQGSTPPLGTEAGETIFGSAFADTINSLGGNDQVQTSGGADLAFGGAGADSIFGGTGNDTLHGGSENDQISGDENDDVIYGDAGDDLLFGGAGADRIFGGQGNDQIQAGIGVDIVSGGAGDDSIFGQSGADIFEFGSGDGQDQFYDFDVSNEIIRLIDSGFNTVSEALAAVSKPFSNVSRITLSEGSYVNVFHDEQSGTPLTAVHIELVSSNNTPSNSGPLGLVDIVGIAAEGSVLTADASGISDAGGFRSFTYTWLRGTIETGDGGVVYNLTTADIGAQISVRVTYTDAQGTFESVTSAKSNIIQNINKAPEGTVIIEGILTEGCILTPNTTALSDADGLGVFDYSWQRDGVEIGETKASYILRSDDIGSAISVIVRYVDLQGTAERVVSASTSAVQTVNSAPSGSIVITGTATEGNTLVVSSASLVNADGLGDVSYIWLRNGEPFGATDPTYTLQAGDIGFEISVQVQFIDGQGSVETATSTATDQVVNANNAPAGAVLPTDDVLKAVQLTGGSTDNAIVGTQSNDIFDINPSDETVTITDFQAGSDALDLSSFARADVLERLAELPSGALSITLSGGTMLTFGDEGISFDALSITDFILAPGDLPASGIPIINGVAQQGETLTVNTSSIQDVDGVNAATLNYQWQRDGQAIDGATDPSFVLGQSEVGHAITVIVQFQDYTGNFEVVSALPTANVENVNDVVSWTLNIPSELTVGDVAESVIVSTSNNEGPSASAEIFQWFRDDREIPAATQFNYTVTSADVGATLSLRLQLMNEFGILETLTSAAVFVPTVGQFVTGTPFADRIIATAGDDTIEGRGGIDTVVFEGSQNSYTISLSKAGVTINDRHMDEDGGQGTDLLRNVEFLEFSTSTSTSNERFNLDMVDDPVNLEATEFAEITELYIAYFNRAPDAIGLYFWASEFDRGYALEQMAKSFFFQDETRATYSEVLSEDGLTVIDEQAFVASVYQNVLGRIPDSEGFQYWVDQLANSPLITPAVLILEVIKGAKYPGNPNAQTAIDQNYLATKADIGTYYSAIKGLSDVEDAVIAMSLFDGTAAGVRAAINQVDAFYEDALAPVNGAFLFQLTGILDDPFAIA